MWCKVWRVPSRVELSPPSQLHTIEDLLTALKACMSTETTRRIHLHAKHSNLYTIYVANALVSSYARSSSMSEAFQVFSRMPQQTSVSWNSLITGYVDNGESKVALTFFHYMEQSQLCQPDARTLVAALTACTSLSTGEEVDGFLETGMSLHTRAVELGYMNDTFLGNSLVNMYAKCGSMVDARLVFDRMPRHDLVSWNSLILGYGVNGECELALELFSRLALSTGFQPSGRTYIAALMSCLCVAENEESVEVDGMFFKFGCLEKSMRIHSQAVKGGECDTHLCMASILLDIYAKCGDLLDARRMFDRMPFHDVVSWTTLILAYAEHGEGELALELFTYMQRYSGCVPNSRTYVGALAAVSALASGKESIMVELDLKLTKLKCLEIGRALHAQAVEAGFDCSDMFLGTALVDMYAKSGSISEARGAFDGIQHHDVVSWTSLILGYAENQQGDVALDCFQLMKHRGFVPDSQTYITVLAACSTSGALETGRKVHSEILERRLEDNPFVANSLIDFYGKCGSMQEAEQVFWSMRRTSVSWCALLAGYARQGNSEQVFRLFESMREEGLQPNRIMFLSVLTSCSHAGLVDRCREYFEAMVRQYGVSPEREHYHCMVDMLGRANMLEEAVEMVKEMPFRANVVTWKTVLGACLKWKNTEIGKVAFENVVRLDPGHDAAYAVMASIYGS